MIFSELYSTVLKAFDEAGWTYTEVEGREVIRAGFEAHHTRVDLHLQVFEGLSAVSIVSESPHAGAGEIVRERVSELAMRVNQTLTVGNFEVDWDRGRLLFRVTNLFSTPQGDISLIQGLVHTTVGEMDRIAPIETILRRAEGAALAALQIPELLNREDLLPEIPAPEPDLD
ncbi:MAG: hypothetical protein KBF76_19575 [Verrucomicrobiales bacterium]|nr:hypothetical protein [Verrucomicrobiales bacterium]